MPNLSPIKAFENVKNVCFLHKVASDARKIVVTDFDPGSSNMCEAVEKFQTSGSIEKLEHHLVGVLLNQMSSKACIRKYGDKEREVLLNEFRRLIGMGTFTTVLCKELKSKQKKIALMVISVIKEKRDGSLKGRTCADGRKQRGACSKEEKSSLTVHSY